MARKNIVQAFEMITDGDMSGEIISEATNIQNLDKVYIRLDWTSSSIDGEIIVEMRQIKPGVNPSSVEWKTVNFGTQILITSDNSSHELLFQELPGTEIRLRYAATGGTGTLNAVLTAKQVGG